jgi:hypothetical protein
MIGVPVVVRLPVWETMNYMTMFAVFIEFIALVFQTYALIRHWCRGWGTEFLRLKYKLKEFMNKLFQYQNMHNSSIMFFTPN